MCEYCNVSIGIYNIANDIADLKFRKKYEANPIFVFMDWIVLEEERLQLSIERWLNDQKNETLSKCGDFSNEIAIKSFNLDKLCNELSSIDFTSEYIYKQIGEFRYEIIKLPMGIDSISKANKPAGDYIDIISEINSNPFADELNKSSIKALKQGGQEVFASIGIQFQFNMRDKLIEDALKNANIVLSDQVKHQLQSKIKYELYEGVKNGEDTRELRNRVLSVYNKPITVNVPPKIIDGATIRAGYSYGMAPKDWAAAVASTEVTKAYIEGKLEGYRQFGIVDYVQFLVTPDERLCERCEPLNGQIYKISEAQGIIPVHPRCRCTFVPYIPEEKRESFISQATSNVQALYASEKMLIKTDAELKLETGTIKKITKQKGGVNGTYKTENGIKGILKYKDEEAIELRDSIPPNTQYLREVAASKYDKIYGFDIVPDTVFREIDGRIASHQLFLDGYKEFVKAPPSWIKEIKTSAAEKFGLFDFLIGNEDRHVGNFMVNSFGKMKAIDHGLSFGQYASTGKRNFWIKMWDQNESIANKEHLSGVWNSLLNKDKLKLLKRELYDSGLLDKESFLSALSRIEYLVENRGVIIEIGSDYTNILINSTNYYNNKNFTVDKAINDLIKKIKKYKEGML